MTIDESWKEHLRELDQLRQSVQNATYEQKDPLVIYKIESFNLFKTMVGTMNNKAVSILMRGQIPVEATQEEPRPAQREEPRHEPKQQYSENRGDDAQRAAASAPQGPQHPTAPIHVGPKVGRNDPCPCGSGKKYKNCHGRGLV